jgi:phosphoribosylanthranilate isomerase
MKLRRPPLPFRIKICGITNLADAQFAAQCGADAIGLNFYERSSRFVPHLDASFICQDLTLTVKRVGVFVNADPREVRETAEQLSLDYVQLHGDESLEQVAALRGLRVIRALRIGDQTPESIEAVIRQWAELNQVQAILLDALDATHYGGTGRRVDWEAVAKLSSIDDLPLILAGGLNAECVAEAIRQTHPAAVDVASGVESAPGQKDQEKVSRFVANAIQAFQNNSACQADQSTDQSS